MARESPILRLGWAAIGALLLAVPVTVIAKPLEPAAPTASAASRAAGRADPADRPVSLTLRETPLRSALEMLFEGSGLQYAVAPDVPNTPLTLSIREIPFQTALRTLLRLAGNVTYQKDGEVYAIRVRRAVPEPAANVLGEFTVGTTAAEAGLHWERVPLNYVNPAVVAVALNLPMLPNEVDLALGLARGYGGGFGGPGNGAYGGLTGGGLSGGLNGGGMGPGAVNSSVYGPFGSSGLGNPLGALDGTAGRLAPGQPVNGVVNGQGNNVLLGPRPRSF